MIPLCDITKLYLEKYLKEARPKMAVEGEKSLFVSSLGQRFTTRSLESHKKYSNLANIDKNINPTMLRHSFAIHLLNEGANIAVVSKILGNVNLSSLQVYLNHIDKNVRREIKEKHPRNDVDVELQKQKLNRLYSKFYNLEGAYLYEQSNLDCN